MLITNFISIQQSVIKTRGLGIPTSVLSYFIPLKRNLNASSFSSLIRPNTDVKAVLQLVKPVT